MSLDSESAFGIALLGRGKDAKSQSQILGKPIGPY